MIFCASPPTRSSGIARAPYCDGSRRAPPMLRVILRYAKSRVLKRDFAWLCPQCNHPFTRATIRSYIDHNHPYNNEAIQMA